MNLLQMSFSGAVLIVAIVLIRAIAIHKLPKNTFIVLWGIVILRLLIPFSIPSMFSFYSFVGYHTPSGIWTGTLPAVNPEAAIPQGQQELINQANPQTVNPAVDVSVVSELSDVTDIIDITDISAPILIWCAGMVICALFFIISYYRSRLEFRTALPVHNEFIEQWQRAHRIKRTISIRQSDRISTPLTYGILHPVILMPKKTDWEDTVQLQYVLLHEYMHICRYDTVIKLMAAAALCLHWFNPFVWAMYVLFNRDIELACDECVVHHLGEKSKSAYACMLISMEAEKSGLTPFCNNFSKNAIEERITAIMKIKKNTLSAILIAAGLIVCVTTTFATSALDTASQTQKLSTIPDTNFTDEEYEKLVSLQFDGYEDMTVTQFRNRVLELTDTIEYKKLLDRFSQDEALYELKDTNEIASFLFYILDPLTAEKWQSRGFGGYTQTNFSDASDNAMLEYFLTLNIEDGDKLTVREYEKTRSAVGDELKAILQNTTTEQLQDEEFMKQTIDAKIDSVEKQWDTDKLKMAVEYSFTPLSIPETEDENRLTAVQNEEEIYTYGKATEEDYQSLLALKTPGYQDMSLADFNMHLLEWANESYERMEKINMETAANDYSIPLSTDDKTFVALTVRVSGMENAEFVKSEYTGDPEQDPILGGNTLEKQTGEGGYAAWSSMYYQYSYHISDKEAVTVGERDRSIGGMENDIKEFWDGTDIEDLLKMTESDVIEKLNEIAAKNSNDKIVITIREDGIGFESMDERYKI
ncbi:M56 family metallopeptidase [Blautia schinkii]|nr:M56 family metallopeptidase [Blautia schinkii]